MYVSTESIRYNQSISRINSVQCSLLCSMNVIKHVLRHGNRPFSPAASKWTFTWTSRVHSREVCRNQRKWKELFTHESRLCSPFACCCWMTGPILSSRSLVNKTWTPPHQRRFGLEILLWSFEVLEKWNFGQWGWHGAHPRSNWLWFWVYLPLVAFTIHRQKEITDSFPPKIKERKKERKNC